MSQACLEFLKMLTLFVLLLLAPFAVLAAPTSFSLGQLVFQFPNSLEIEHDAAPPPPSAVPLAGPSPSTISLVYQFKEERLENLHARSNGHLIVNVVNKPLI